MRWDPVSQQSAADPPGACHLRIGVSSSRPPSQTRKNGTARERVAAVYAAKQLTHMPFWRSTSLSRAAPVLGRRAVAPHSARLSASALLLHRAKFKPLAERLQRELDAVNLRAVRKLRESAHFLCSRA